MTRYIRNCFMKCFRHFWMGVAASSVISGLASFATVQGQDFKPFDQFLNISTRVLVGGGDNAMIVGFIVMGNDPKKVIIRAIGPSLTGGGISNVLSDPTLELRDGSGALIASNDNWRDTQQAEIQASGLAPADDRESAIIQTLSTGTYTAILRGKDGAGGIGLIEGYDLDQTANSILANISTRGFVGTGENVMIGGLIVGGNASGGVNVVIARAIGPSLSNAGIQNVLQDPTLELRDTNGGLIDFNDNWKDRQEAVIENQNLAPGDDRESAMLEVLPPGAYTAIVSGKDGGTGVGLVEFFNVQ
jgi:hypothetical protein